MEFKKKNLLDVFSANARAVWDAGASATIELLPNDELIPYIDEVITFSFDRFGALPHLTIARNDATAGRDYLTNLTMEEYERVWSVFDSDMWRFKRTIFGVKRNEFCYAGAWSLYVNLETGNAVPCYCGTGRQNIYDDLSKPIRFDPIGLCPLPHCYNGHALLTQGLIPRFTDYLYGNIRDRTRLDGSHWLQPEMLNFLNGKLENQNSEYCVLKQKIIISRRIAEKVFASIKKRALKIIR
ncbi:MAG: hypothetical protein LBS72_00465 [Oscillospiraceae bacterium]|nr:hypothetical protein [Oscillospiraceae bacterium]